MALTISQAGSGNSTSSSATLAVTLTQSFAVGDMVVVCIASDNNGTNGADSVLSVTEYKICHKSWVFLASKKDLSTSIFAMAFKN